MLNECNKGDNVPIPSPRGEMFVWEKYFNFSRKLLLLRKKVQSKKVFIKKKRSHVPFKQNDFEKSSPLIVASIKDQQNWARCTAWNLAKMTPARLNVLRFFTLILAKIICLLTDKWVQNVWLVLHSKHP